MHRYNRVKELPGIAFGSILTLEEVDGVLTMIGADLPVPGLSGDFTSDNWTGRLRVSAESEIESGTKATSVAASSRPNDDTRTTFMDLGRYSFSQC